jgi:protein FAM32A
MPKAAFVGGSLSFKGDKKKAKKKKNKSKHSLGREEEGNQKQKVVKDPDSNSEDGFDDDMTDAERAAVKFKRERQRQESEKIAQKSHRERVEEFNEQLGSLTELNDIPRVSFLDHSDVYTIFYLLLYPC